MKTPPLLIGAALLLWGWQGRLLYVALILAALLEGARFTKTRWDFSEPDFRRIADLCTILLAILVLVALLKEAGRFMMLTLQWVPLAVFPLMAAQQYSRLGKIPGHTLFILLRRKRENEDNRRFIFDISYPYFFLCLISAAAVNAGRSWFYYGLCLLVAWALWPLRSRRYPIYLWVVLLVVVSSVGYAGQAGLYRLHSLILEKAYDYFSRSRDPFRSTTAIGEVLELKQSSRILFRVTPLGPVSLPIRLREASYTAYDRATWYATHSGFEELLPEPRDPSEWALAPPAADARRLQFVMRLPRGRHLFKLPGGTFRLRELSVAQLEKNTLGAVRSDDGAGLTVFLADYAPGLVFNRPPDEADLKIPAAEAPAIREVGGQLSLNAKSAEDAIAAIRAFFGNDFRYTLNLDGPLSHDSGLADFLLRRRSGHCEYFATATVLLLRAAGIPARYVSGYSAGEYSPLEGSLVVRQRHAHAWALAYVSGNWLEVDTTPPDWLALESAGASPLVRVSDFFSFLRLRLALWRHSLQMKELTLYLVLALVALGLLFIKRLTGEKHMRRVTAAEEAATPSSEFPGLESEFYAIEAWLNRQGHHRQPGETFRSWFQRLAAEAPDVLSLAEMQPLLALHYRCRFGPEGLRAEDRERLISGVQAWITQKLRRGATRLVK